LFRFLVTKKLLLTKYYINRQTIYNLQYKLYTKATKLYKRAIESFLKLYRDNIYNTFVIFVFWTKLDINFY